MKTYISTPLLVDWEEKKGLGMEFYNGTPVEMTPLSTVQALTEIHCTMETDCVGIIPTKGQNGEGLKCEMYAVFDGTNVQNVTGIYLKK